ncbi:MAG: PTS sugar transporter subunit IIA [Myxococcota bacterium]
MIGIVIATHGTNATALFETCTDMLGETVAACVAISMDADIEMTAGHKQIVEAVDSVDNNEGVLILVDMFGGIPSTLAMGLLAQRNIEVLTGVNLAMVLRSVLRRENTTLPELAADVLSYGHRNVTSSAQWLSPTPLNRDTSS